jgi:hypothetical protein
MATMEGVPFPGMAGVPGAPAPIAPNGAQPIGPPGGYNPGGAPPGVTGVNPGIAAPNGAPSPASPSGPGTPPGPVAPLVPSGGSPDLPTPAVLSSGIGGPAPSALPPLPATIGAAALSTSQLSSQPSSQPRAQATPLAVEVNNGANGVVALPQSSALIALVAAMGVALWS